MWEKWQKKGKILTPKLELGGETVLLQLLPFSTSQSKKGAAEEVDFEIWVHLHLVNWKTAGRGDKCFLWSCCSNKWSDRGKIFSEVFYLSILKCDEMLSARCPNLMGFVVIECWWKQQMKTFSFQKNLIYTTLWKSIKAHSLGRVHHVSATFYILTLCTFCSSCTPTVNPHRFFHLH